MRKVDTEPRVCLKLVATASSFCFHSGSLQFTSSHVDFRFEKHFTLEEANALIPAIRRVFEHVHAILDIGSGTGGLKSNDPPAGSKGNGAAGNNGNGNGNGVAHAPAKNDYSQLSCEERKRAASALLDTLGRQGIVLQDFTRGLIDFPSVRDGEEILLCYELADGDEIQFFHGLDTGYAGRQPL